MICQCRGHLGSQPSYLVEEISHAPRENPGVPEIAIVHHRLGPGAIRLLHETRYLSGAAFSLFAGLDIPEALVRTSRDYADRDECMLLARYPFGTGERCSKPVVVGNGPVSVHADHRRVARRPSLDHERSPCQRGGRSGRHRFGDDILAGNRGRRFRDRICQRCVRENQSVIGRHEVAQAIERIHEQRAVVHEREQLLRALRRAQRPEARSHASGENDRPPSHSILSTRRLPRP